MSSRETAWAAGLFEGEGSIVRHGVPLDAGRRPHWQLTLRMTDRDIVDRFAAWAGIGKVYAEKPKANPKHKDTFLYIVSARRDVYDVLRRLRPWFGERRGWRAKEAMAELPPFTKVRGSGRKQKEAA